MDQDLILLVLIDLRKAYNNLDWEKLIKTLVEYGADQN